MLFISVIKSTNYTSVTENEVLRVHWDAFRLYNYKFQCYMLIRIIVVNNMIEIIDAIN